LLASKLSSASPLQTISRSVTMPIRRSFSPIGMAPMSCSNPIDSFVHHVFDFHDPPPLLDFAHSVKSNPGSLDASDYTTDRALLGLSAATAAVPPLAPPRSSRPKFPTGDGVR
jgi:hypothetical protein